MREQKSGIFGQIGDRFADCGLELNKPEVSEYKQEEEMEGFDPCLLLNEHMGVLMEALQGDAAALDQLTSELLSEHQNVWTTSRDIVIHVMS